MLIPDYQRHMLEEVIYLMQLLYCMINLSYLITN